MRCIVNMFIFCTALLGNSLYASEYCFQRPNTFLEYLRFPEEICLEGGLIESITFKNILKWNGVDKKVERQKFITSSKSNVDVIYDGMATKITDAELDLSSRFLKIELNKYQLPTGQELKVLAIFYAPTNDEHLLGLLDLSLLKSVVISNGKYWTPYKNL